LSPYLFESLSIGQRRLFIGTINTLAAVSVLALAVTVTSGSAFARDGGAIAAGVVGGLAVGAIVGSPAQRNYHGEPNYYEDTGYRAGYRGCHTERQEVSDGYGNVRIRRVRVCD
jgi:hypothetical protein